MGERAKAAEMEEGESSGEGGVKEGLLEEFIIIVC